MKIENRLFPYPVLCKENDDYVGSFFNINMSWKEELKDIVINFEIELNDKSLEKVIRTGLAEYIIHLECSNTSFRKVVKNAGKSFDYRIPKSKVNKEIEIVGMIVALKEIHNFHSDNFNEDYTASVNLEKGDILAYQNLPRLIVIKNYEELARDDAFFTIVCRNVEAGVEEPVTFDINGDKIKIFVDKGVYGEYVKFHTNPNMRPIMVSLLILPALIYVIEEVRGNGADKYVSNYWYQRIRKSCELQGKKFIEDIIDGNSTSIEIAQEMLQLPIGSAFRNLSEVAEG